MEKYSSAGQATDDNMAHAHCMMNATNTHSEYVIFIAFFQRQKMAARKALNVTFIRELEL